MWKKCKSWSKRSMYENREADANKKCRVRHMIMSISIDESIPTDPVLPLGLGEKCEKNVSLFDCAPVAGHVVHSYMRSLYTRARWTLTKCKTSRYKCQI